MINNILIILLLIEIYSYDVCKYYGDNGDKLEKFLGNGTDRNEKCFSLSNSFGNGKCCIDGSQCVNINSTDSTQTSSSSGSSGSSSSVSSGSSSSGSSGSSSSGSSGSSSSVSSGSSSSVSSGSSSSVSSGSSSSVSSGSSSSGSSGSSSSGSSGSSSSGSSGSSSSGAPGSSSGNSLLRNMQQKVLQCPSKNGLNIYNNCGMAGIYEPQNNSTCIGISLVQGYCCFTKIEKGNDKAKACLRAKQLNKDKSKAPAEIEEYVKNIIGDGATISVECGKFNLKFYLILNFILSIIYLF